MLALALQGGEFLAHQIQHLGGGAEEVLGGPVYLAVQVGQLLAEAIGPLRTACPMLVDLPPEFRPHTVEVVARQRPLLEFADHYIH